MKHLNLFVLFIVLAVLFYSCQQQTNMNNESAKNEAAMMKIWDAFNTGNTDSLGNYIADDAVDHAMDTAMAKSKGPEGLKEMIDAYRTAFPDLHIKSDVIASKGDTVLGYYTFTGTNSGPFMGMPATNKSVNVNGVDIVRFQDGKAVEHWEVTDQLGFMRQMGLIPPKSEPMQKNKMK